MTRLGQDTLNVLAILAALVIVAALAREARRVFAPHPGTRVKTHVPRSWRLDFDDVSRAGLDGNGQPPAAGPGHPEDYDPEFWGEQDALRPVAEARAEMAGPGRFYPQHDDETCPNCGRWGFDGTLCNACGWGYGWQPAYEAQVTAVIPPGECLCIIGNDMGCVTTNTHNCPAHGTLDPEPDTIIDSKPRVSGGRHARPEAAWDVYLREGVPPSLEYVLAALTLPLPQVKALAAAS